MQIKVIKVDLEDKGKYQVAEVTYKNTKDGKVASKKVMSFVGSYGVLKVAKEGEVYDIKAVKDDKGFWVWEGASPGVEGPAETGAPVGQGARPTASPRSTFETPEERRQRQFYISRQSSLQRALEFLTLNGAKKASTDEVIAIAKEFERYVLSPTENPFSSLADLKSDIPM